MNSSTSNTSPESNMEDFEAALQQAGAVEEKYAPSVSKSDTKKDFNAVAQHAGLPQSSPASYDRSWIYAAAAIFLVAAVGISYLSTTHHISAPVGTLKSVTLPDHSTVTLNGGSELSYTRWFSYWGRSVSLQGEAFFEVSSSDAPFKVHAGNGLITVTGTKFNVRSGSVGGRELTSVYLIEGEVLFSSAQEPEQSVRLKPGQGSELSMNESTPVAPHSADTSRALAWLRQDLNFERMSLQTVFGEIGGRFNVQIKARNEHILQDTLTIYLSDISSAEEAIQDICQAKGLSYHKDQQSFVISKAYH